MASDKIVQKILDSANQEAKITLQKAEEEAKHQTDNINKDTQTRLSNLKKQFETDCVNAEKHAKLNAGIEERKKFLAAKRKVMEKAFDLARRELKNLDEKTWKELITKIVLAGTANDTEYIKVPEKDMPRFTRKTGRGTFLDELNDLLREQGLKQELKLDRDPAKFSDGIMLIGKYSDVNASFDVLLDNMYEDLEWEVSEILFGEGE